MRKPSWRRIGPSKTPWMRCRQEPTQNNMAYTNIQLEARRGNACLDLWTMAVWLCFGVVSY
ncbi:hypothetical protein VFPFJ_01130 [Purpureocillium lilacinum]|uniref:Uncharacterized protein n=1 Tax=Purpureocillium lilacinum TaxID=33203 RepID=A0A179HZP3_PURLI|nr:hypothetical protein VFPFJ_01130 [Purpureocillium lilacinum]OAQ95021.1 hypothetical protein VFPFJ_01130 [Purpureocillium lilacinum]